MFGPSLNATGNFLHIVQLLQRVNRENEIAVVGIDPERLGKAEKGVGVVKILFVVFGRDRIYSLLICRGGQSSRRLTSIGTV